MAQGLIPPAGATPPGRNPCKISYQPLYNASGITNDILTGEVQFVRGGGRLATIYSGSLAGAGLGAAPNAVAAGADVFFFSGAGRLNAVTLLAGVLSGQGVTFYDTALAASGGPIPTSGHKSLFRLPSSTEGVLPVNSGGILAPQKFSVDAPFQSGLACRASSGCPAFSVEYTPEVSQAFNIP